MRALIITQPGLGHWHPLVPLARALESAGHEIAFAAPPNFCKLIEGKGFPYFPAGRDETPEELARRAALFGSLSPAERAVAMWKTVFTGSRAKHTLPDLMAIISDWHPDVLIPDNTVMPGFIAAEKAGIPHAAFQVTAARARVLGLIDDEFNALGASIGLPPMNPSEVVHRYLLLLPRPLSLWDPASPPPPTAHAFRYFSFNQSGSEQLPGWIDSLPQLPTVYATLGTVYNNLSAVHHAILEALRDEPLNLILTIGRDRDPSDFGPQPPNVHIERYIPQDLILPYCDLSLNHGGSGTTLDALSLGLPMVIIPIAADQPQNAELCAAQGVARVIQPDQRTPEAIREAVLEVLHNPSYKQAAQRLQSEIQSLPDLDYAVSLLERLAAHRAPLLSPSF